MVISFDDGYENILKYAQKPLENSRIQEKKVFIVTNYIGKYNSWDFSFYLNRYKHLNKNQIKELSSMKWDIGSHGLSHQSFLSMSFDNAKNEIINSKNILEDIVGNKIISIAPPFGQINQRIYDICVEVGYKNIYLQNNFPKISLDTANIFVRRNIYSIDNNLNILKKIKLENIERKKEKIISSFNNLTIFFSKYVS